MYNMARSQTYLSTEEGLALNLWLIYSVSSYSTLMANLSFQVAYEAFSLTNCHNFIEPTTSLEHLSGVQLHHSYFQGVLKMYCYSA